MKKLFLSFIFIIGTFATTQSAFGQSCFIGEVRAFGGNFAPRGWAFARGQILPIAQNTALFSIIGTTYGGDGRTTMALPDLGNRVVPGAGRGPGLTNVRLGQELGSNTAQTVGSHRHAVRAVQVKEGPNANNSGDTETKRRFLYADVAANESEQNFFTTNNGNGASQVDNRQPSLGVNYIICLQGIYPSRS